MGGCILPFRAGCVGSGLERRIANPYPTALMASADRQTAVSMRGNRKLNHAIHMAAVTQISHDTGGRVYYNKKQAEGKTRKEALRALKRRISDAVYRKLVADQQS